MEKPIEIKALERELLPVSHLLPLPVSLLSPLPVSSPATQKTGEDTGFGDN